MLLSTPRADERTVGIRAQAIRRITPEGLLDGAADLHDMRAAHRRLDATGICPWYASTVRPVCSFICAAAARILGSRILRQSPARSGYTTKATFISSTC